ncbi:MAG: prepilin-type N-terminal cleavage/methylation domain-containing protein [Lentisphaeraceae bacterium]|nr:prepilin-type N-terminal cleavage/methylation domain-containing protein [Lentisphaeraceae bacterium]
MRNRFTLIELLIVCAIIGILLTLLLPSLSRAREKTRRAVCMSNLAQMYRGLVVHGNQYDNDLPASQPVTNGDGIFAIKHINRWHGHGKLYQREILTDTTIYYCPSSKIETFSRGGINPNNSNYGGFPTDPETPLLRTVISSYQYRSSFNAPNYEKPSFLKNNPEDALMSDHSSFNFAQQTHIEGHNVSFIDGSVSWNGDKTLLFLNLNNNQHTARENQFWKKVDR